MPKVSIIIPAYNSSEYIKETIESILLQEFNDFEIIVVDDASTDSTHDVVDSIESDKIRYIRLPANHGGPSKPRNVGIANARGEYIAFFDSDDLMMPGRIESAVSALDAWPNVGMIFTDARKFNEKDGDCPDTFLCHYDLFAALKTDHRGNGLFIIEKTGAYKGLFFENYILTCGVTVRKSVFDNVGFFDESLTNADDWDMWLRISQQNNLGFLDFVSFKYRVRDSGITGRGIKNNYNKIRILRNRIECGLDESTLKQAKKLIALNYADMGYANRCSNQLELARENYMSSLKENMNWKIIFQYLITYMSNDLIGFMRDLKHKFK